MRAHARFCSAGCRQSAYRTRKAAVTKPRKAHQQFVKEQLRATEPAQSDDIRRAEVRAITLSEARSVIERYEPMPAVGRLAFGIFFADRLGGAVVFGDEYAANLGVWQRYGYDGKIIALLRGACTHWAPHNTASKLIRRAMRLLPKRYSVITATVDDRCGEIGAVYQAAGFHFVGVMRQGGRALVSINGKLISERQAGRIAGTRGAQALAQLGFDASPVPRRSRYFAFRGKERRVLQAAIGGLIKPYPKRNA
jgi:hypothetical protein